MTDMIIATTLERDQEQFANQIIASKGERKMLTAYTAQVNRILTNIELEDDLDI